MSDVDFPAIIFSMQGLTQNKNFALHLKYEWSHAKNIPRIKLFLRKKPQNYGQCLLNG